MTITGRARPEIDGRDTNQQMVADGLPWHLTRYSDGWAIAAGRQTG